jgi:hypothetical protein
MKVGDLVRHAHAHKRENMTGIILEEAYDPRDPGNRNTIFNVLWRNGKIVKNVWDYDLVMIK